MINDDLSTLFDKGQPGVRFRQGTVLSWNPANGENTVDMGGGTLTNVPILNTGEAIALKAGHVVGLLGQGRVWFIVGRITQPDDPNFAAASVAFGAGGAQSFGFAANQTTAVVMTSNELVVPDWADEAIVMVTGNGGCWNGTASEFQIGMQVGVLGGSGGTPFTGVPAGSYRGFGASSRNHFTGLSGGEVLTLEASLTTQNGVLAADPTNALFMHAIAIYKSNV